MSNNTKQMRAVQVNAGAGSALATLCLRSCRKILAQIGKAREAIFDDSRKTPGAPERLLQLALNEAEAIAWQTGYPHLLFPVLAMEKVRAVADWNRHQRSVRQLDPLLALAA